MNYYSMFDFPLFGQSPNAVYIPKRSTVVKNKRRRAHQRRTKRRK